MIAAAARHAPMTARSRTGWIEKAEAMVSRFPQRAPHDERGVPAPPVSAPPERGHDRGGRKACTNDGTIAYRLDRTGRSNVVPYPPTSHINPHRMIRLLPESTIVPFGRRNTNPT